MGKCKDSLVQYIDEPKQYHASLVQYIDEPKQYLAFLVQYIVEWINTDWFNRSMFSCNTYRFWCTEL